MTNALAQAYPSDRTLIGQIFQPVVDPRVYLRAFHLLLMFPLGIGYFVFLAVTFSVGGSLIWTFPGAAIVLASILVSRVLGDLESRTVTAVSGVEIRRPPWRLEGIEGWRGRLWARLIDPTTWTGLVYLVGQFPVGIAAFVSLVTIFSVAGAFVGAPLIVLFTDEPLDIANGDWFTVDTPAEALWLVPVGLLVFLAALHLVTAFSVLHAVWARFMLGSRTDLSRPTGDQPNSPDPGLPDSPEDDRQPAPESSSSPGLAAVHPFSPEPQLTASANAPPPEQAAAYEKLGHLTPREREVVLLIADGMSNAEIAETCFISQGTVKTHVKRVLAKLELRDRSQVVVFAYETGLVMPVADNRRQLTAGVR